ncbi:uncharacterized protein LOC107363129 [Tetranychus urticae]|nr:uncharacterized protein LOC107363129 [Tetranychus urticae]
MGTGQGSVKTALTSIKSTGSVRSRSSLKSSSYCASNFDVVDQTMSAGLHHQHSYVQRNHEPIGKSIKSNTSSTRSHRTVSFATVNERFLKVLKRSVKNPSGSVVSRRSILECDLTAYDLIEQSLHETCIEDEDIVVDEEKENYHYNDSMECLSDEEESEDIMDRHRLNQVIHDVSGSKKYQRRSRHCSPSLSSSTKGLHSIPNSSRNMLPRLGESSLRYKPRVKAISSVDLSQKSIITDGKASLKKGLRIGGQGMSLFPSAVETKASSTSGVVKSRSSESILSASDKSSSITSSNLTDRPASCLLLPLPEPDYDSETGSDNDAKHRGQKIISNGSISRSCPRILSQAQSFTQLNESEPTTKSDFTSSRANFIETRSLDRRGKRRTQLKQSMSSSSLSGNANGFQEDVTMDDHNSLRQLGSKFDGSSTISIPSDVNYMAKVKSILKKSVTWNESVTKTHSLSSDSNCDTTYGSTNSDSDFSSYRKCSSSVLANSISTLPRVRGRWSSSSSERSTISANGVKGPKIKKHVHFGCSKDDDSLIIEHIGETIFEEDEEPIYDDIANVISNDLSPGLHQQNSQSQPQCQPATAPFSRLPQPPPPPPPPPPPHSSSSSLTPTSQTPLLSSSSAVHSKSLNGNYKRSFESDVDNNGNDEVNGSNGSGKGGNKLQDDRVNELTNGFSSAAKTTSSGTDEENKGVSTRRVYGVLDTGDSVNSPRSTSSYLKLAPKSSDQMGSDSLTNSKKTGGSKEIKEQPASPSLPSISSNQPYKISRSGIINGLRREVESSDEGELVNSGGSIQRGSNNIQSNGNLKHNDNVNTNEHNGDNNNVDGDCFHHPERVNRLKNSTLNCNIEGPLSPEFTSSLTNHHQNQQQQQHLNKYNGNQDERNASILSELRAGIKEKLENKLIKDIIISNELKALAEKSSSVTSCDSNRYNGWSTLNQRSKSTTFNDHSNVHRINQDSIKNNLNGVNDNHRDVNNCRNNQDNYGENDDDGDISDERNLGKADYGFTISIVNNVNSARNRNPDYGITSPYSSNTSSSSYYDTHLPSEESSKIVINVPLGGGVGGNNFYDNEPNEHIYEELDKVSIYGANKANLEINGLTINESNLGYINHHSMSKRSIFEGASRDEILEYLAGAKERVEVLIDETSPTSLNHHSHHGLVTRPNLASTRRNRTSNVSNVSSSSNDSSTTATSSSIETEDCSLTNSTTGTPVERNDSGVGVETSKPTKIRRSNNLLSSPGESERLCADCEQLIEPKETNENRDNNIEPNQLEDNNDIIYYTLVCNKCEKKRSERKEIISEFVDTEFKYGRDLRIIREEFHRPMEVAGLLTKEQIKGVFINLEELINVNSKFSEKLQDAIDIASEQGDEDFTTVNIGKLFMESASMLHSFETYCLRQGSASVLLNQLEKEKELLRIFLRVSQMENTLLRRMNLSAFLMVPVQRVTKYPLLLNRLYKVTPHHHQDRDALKLAQQKVEIHLEHINQQTKGSTAPTKIWRKFSHLSNRRLPSIDDIGDIKLRKVALEAMNWTRDQANFIMSGRLSFLPSSEYQLYKKRGNIKFSSASCLLMSLGEMLPSIKSNLADDDEEFERELMFPRSNHGCEQAVLILIKEKHSRYTLCREPFNLASCVISSDSEFEDLFEIHEQNTKESFILKADSPTEKRDWYRQICYHSKNLGNWRKRRNALANIMMVRP